MKTVYKLLVIGAVVSIILLGMGLRNEGDYLNTAEETVAKQEILINKLEKENEKLRELVKINDVLNTYYSHKPLKTRRQLAELIYLAAKENDLTPEIILAVIMTESSFRDEVVSNKGAIGLMQLLPSTAAAISKEVKVKWRGDSTLYDSKNNIRLGAYYLRKMMQVFDDMNDALTAYNAGPGRVNKYAQEGKQYSDKYARKVNQYYKLIRDTYYEE